LSPEPVEDSRITQFQELATRQLVNPKIIQNITKKMNINTMTEIQSLTIHETLEGDDL
jgi:ATP-dependent RNA helicase MSS116